MPTSFLFCYWHANFPKYTSSSCSQAIYSEACLLPRTVYKNLIFSWHWYWHGPLSGTKPTSPACAMGLWRRQRESMFWGYWQLCYDRCGWADTNEGKSKSTTSEIEATKKRQTQACISSEISRVMNLLVSTTVHSVIISDGPLCPRHQGYNDKQSRTFI